MADVVPHGGSVYSSTPSASPRYWVAGARNRYETQARLGVRGADDPRLNFSGDFDRYKQALAGLGYIDFLLQSAVEPLSEIFQVSEVLSDAYVPWFFGQHAPMFSYSGTLLNSKEDRWRSEWLYLYKEILRGSRLADKGLLVSLQYGSVLVEGALTSMVQSMQATDETAIQFHFQMLVRRFTELDPPRTPINNVDISFESLRTELVVDDTDADLVSTDMFDGSAFSLGLSALDEAQAVGVTSIPVDVANLGWE